MGLPIEFVAIDIEIYVYIGGHASSEGEGDKDGCKDGRYAGEVCRTGEEPEAAAGVAGDQHPSAAEKH